MPFDYATHVVIAHGLVFFGSSADGKVYALDAATGAERWATFTDAPVRFAPAIWRDRVLVTSDDGHLYCLDAATGEIVWKRRGGPMADWLLGNGRMIARWPARGAPLLTEDAVYFAAGIWPSEGIYLYELDAKTGKVRWGNDSAGYIEMDQPHPTADAKSGVSVQGYMSAAGETLITPTGRAVPAAFDRINGALRYFHLQEYRANRSDPFIVLADDYTFVSNDLFRTSDGRLLTSGIPAAAMAVLPRQIVFARKETIQAIDRAHLLTEQDAVDRKGNPYKKYVLGESAWEIDCGESLGTSLIGAGSIVVAGTADNTVLVADLGSKSVVSQFEVDGLPLGLAAAGGRLYVSTDRGTIYCFGETRHAPPVDVHAELNAEPYGDNVEYAAAAEEIIAKTDITNGYCVDLGCETGALAFALAQRTQLRIYAVTDDAQALAAIRERFDSAGLYGTQVSVLHCNEADTRLPNYFANLVVSETSLIEGTAGVTEAEVRRLQRPYGGVVCIGKPGEMTLDVRGPLEGAGEWTHQYADPANANCSSDTIVRGPLGMLWFIDNEFIMPSRHGRGPAPLFWNGLLFVEGLNGIRALDAYNGTLRWEYAVKDILKPYDQEHLNGVAITQSNMCIANGRLYLRVADRCRVLDAMTGAKRGEFTAPPRLDGRVGTWGYLACENDNLFGSLCNEEHTVHWAFQPADMSQLFSESLLFFALDAASGKRKWTYTPKDSIRHNAIAIGNGRVHLIDRPLAIRDRSEKDSTVHPPGELVTLDAETGAELWRATDDIYGTVLVLSTEHNVLVMGYQNTRFKLPSEIGGRLTAFRADTGKVLWDVPATYESRFVLNGQTIYAQSGMWDLMTGKETAFPFTRSYGCGTVAGSKHLLAYRSATLGYWDLLCDAGNENYGGIRPGCWINTLPVGGLLLLPEASNRCTCSYLIKATIALQPYGLRAPAIVPNGGTFREPTQVRLTSATSDAAIHYTLDGLSPTTASPKYTGPISVAKNATLRTRAYIENTPPSPINEAAFVVDPNRIPMDDPRWSVYDSPGANPPSSDWQVQNGVVTERSNLYKGDAKNPDPAMEREGSFRVYTPENPGRDGQLDLDIASDDNDVFGVAFRYQDPEHYYLFAMDQERGFHVLACKQGETYRVLASNANRYDSGRWYHVRITLEGSNIAVYLDGKKDLEAVDGALAEGSLALYAWGCAGAKFRHIAWEPVGAKHPGDV